MQRSCGFYSVLGLIATYGGPDAQFTTFSLNAPVTAANNALHINLVRSSSYEPPPAAPGVAGGWGRAVIFVSDVDALHAQLAGAGVEAAPPRDAPWGERYFHVLDPDGHELSFATPDYTHPRWAGPAGGAEDALEDALQELRDEQQG